jgi:hypothetical protein
MTPSQPVAGACFAMAMTVYEGGYLDHLPVPLSR